MVNRKNSCDQTGCKTMNSHGGDVLQEVLYGPGTVAGAAGEVEQREDGAALGLIAVDLLEGTGARGRTVQQGAQVLLEEESQEEENLPARDGCVQYMHPGSSAQSNESIDSIKKVFELV